MILFIGIVVILIMICGAAVSTKAISKRSKDDSDAVYRDNYRYRNQYREEKDDSIPMDLPKEEEMEESSSQQQMEDESQEKQEEEQEPVIAPGEDIKK